MRLKGPAKPPLPRWVDPIWLETQVYARNSRGLHVPVESLTVQEQLEAPEWRSRTIGSQELP